MDSPAHTRHRSPSSSQLATRVFVDSGDQPLKVFLQADEILNRHLILRKLKRGHASICSEIADAHLLVIAPKTAGGKELIRAWETEEDKLFLSLDWLFESVKRGKAYLADENWGGFRILGSDDPATNHLPTPRDTPSETETMNPQDARLPSFSNATQPPPPASNTANIQFQQPQMGFMPNNGHVPGAPYDPNAVVPVPAQLFSQMMAFMSQQAPNVGMMPMPNQAPANMMQGQAPPQGPPQAMQFMAPGMFSQGAVPGAFPQQTNVSYPHAQSMGPGSPMQTSPRESFSSNRRHSTADSFGLSSMDGGGPPHYKRKASSTDPPSKKQRRVSAVQAAAPLAYTGNAGMLFQQSEGKPYDFWVQVELRNRKKIVDIIKKHGGRLVADIQEAHFVVLGYPTTRDFEHWLRQTEHFGKIPLKPQWVMECLEQRTLLDEEDFMYEGFTTERKRGRPSSSGQRYVLKSPKVKSEPKTPKARAAVDPESDFGSESESEESDYESEEQDPPPKKTMKKEIVKQEKPKKMKEAPVKVKAEKKVTVKAEKAEKKAERKPEKKSTSGSRVEITQGSAKSSSKGKSKIVDSPCTSSGGHWEPSPPPPTRVEQHCTGKNLYTGDDIAYFDKYVPILLMRDPWMTTSAIAEKLHAKMPHHSAGSWQTRLSQPAQRESLKLWKRRAEIAMRKGQSFQTSESKKPSASASKNSVISRDPSSSTDQSRKKAPIPASFDAFQALTDFFVAGGADELQDSEVWSTLAQKYPQMTVRDWEGFWTARNAEITAEVSRRTSEQSTRSNGDTKQEPE